MSLSSTVTQETDLARDTLRGKHASIRHYDSSFGATLRFYEICVARVVSDSVKLMALFVFLLARGEYAL